MSGKELKKILSLNDLTYEKAAKLLSVSRGTLINWLQKEELSEKIVLKVQRMILDNNLQTNTNFTKNIAINGHHNTLINSHIDQRSYYSDSPDVLRAQIDELDRMLLEKEERIKEKDAQIKEKDAQIKEKDAQIKEKDAQINKLLEIIGK